MNTLKVIALGAAAYFAFGKDGGSYKKKIEDLEKRLDEAAATAATAQEDMQKLKDQYEGDLRDRVTVMVRGAVSRISWWGDYWNSEFRMNVTNTSPVNITLAGVRLYWTVNGLKSRLIPWTTSSYVIKPKETVTVILYGFQNENHFNSVAEIKEIEKIFKDSGENKEKQTYKKVLPMLCEADFVLVQNGQKYKYALKNIPGTLTGYTDGRVFDPHKSLLNQEKAQAAFDEIPYHT